MDNIQEITNDERRQVRVCGQRNIKLSHRHLGPCISVIESRFFACSYNAVFPRVLRPQASKPTQVCRSYEALGTLCWSRLRDRCWRTRRCLGHTKLREHFHEQRVANNNKTRPILLGSSCKYAWCTSFLHFTRKEPVTKIVSITLFQTLLQPHHLLSSRRWKILFANYVLGSWRTKGAQRYEPTPYTNGILRKRRTTPRDLPHSEQLVERKLVGAFFFFPRKYSFCHNCVLEFVCGWMVGIHASLGSYWDSHNYWP